MKTNDNRETGANKAKGHRRRNYIVNSAFQWKYALTISAMVFLVSSVASSILYAVLHQQARMRLVHPESYTGEVMYVVCFASLVFALVTASGVGFWSMIVTQRICGPLLVVDRYLKELAGGRIPNIRPLRRKDEFKEFYATFTKTVDALRKNKRADHAALNGILKSAESAIAGDDRKCKLALESVARGIESLRDASTAGLEGEIDVDPVLSNETTPPVWEKVGAA